MIHCNLKAAKMLINQVINETQERWAQIDKSYLIGYSKKSTDTHLEVQPVYDEVFYGINDCVQIAIACGCSFYVKCEENQSGKLTPTLHIY